MSILQPRAHPCTRKPLPRLRSDRMFWNFYLNGVDKSALSVRGSAHALMSISNLNARDNLDACRLLVHYANLKSEETSFMWIWLIFKKFQLWNFLKFWKFGVFWLLGHYSNLKSEEIGFMWIWRIFKKFQFWKFWNFFNIWNFFLFDDMSYKHF